MVDAVSRVESSCQPNRSTTQINSMIKVSPSVSQIMARRDSWDVVIRPRDGVRTKKRRLTTGGRQASVRRYRCDSCYFFSATLR